MTKQEIIDAVNEGKKVFCSKGMTYQVIKDSKGQFLIKHLHSNYCIGLHGLEGTKYENVLNADEKDFFIQD
jgi:hypothetical protein